MLNNVIAIAREGMAAQAQRIEEAAQTIASAGSTPASGPQTAPSTSVHVAAALPVGDTLEEAMVTLVEAQMAYKANALVVATAADMMDTFLDAVDPRPDRRD